VVERLVGWLKEFHRIATQYDKLAVSYLAFVQLAAIRLWIQNTPLKSVPGGKVPPPKL
jgi:transposase